MWLHVQVHMFDLQRLLPQKHTSLLVHALQTDVTVQAVLTASHSEVHAQCRV